MLIKFFRACSCLLLLSIMANAQSKQFRVIVIKAHPDEAEEYAGGTAALLAKEGHAVKFLSVTNGDVGHWTMTKTEIAARRKKEAFEAGNRLGVNYEILDHHDGELESSIALRKEVVEAIRSWKADIVITFLPILGAGHPDNMAVARTVQESAGLNVAPLFLPDVPALTKVPVFLYMRDYYSKKLPHQPDIVVPIDSTMDQKLASFDAHASQFYEFAPYQRGILNEVPKDDEGKKAFLNKYWGEFSAVSPDMQKWLQNWFGAEKTPTIKYAEEFEFAPYSRKLSKEELVQLFPSLKI